MRGVRELSLSPYPGRLFYARSRTAYERAHKELFGESDPLKPFQAGRFSARGRYRDGVYLVWAANHRALAHELSHVILDVFTDVGIDPREASGEPFCYMLSQLLLDAES